jgi:hypothetical protein
VLAGAQISRLCGHQERRRFRPADAPVKAQVAVLEGLRVS